MSPLDVTRAIALYRDRYNDTGLFESSVYDGVPQMLSELTGQGATLALATSKPTGSATRILEHFGLSVHFTAIAGADLAGHREAKADVITHALELLGRPSSDVMMVGDRRHDVVGAAHHGIPTVGVLWGYGDEPELRQAGAAALAASPAEVPVFVREAGRRD
jgi:phosphoglycolate phosphatase